MGALAAPWERLGIVLGSSGRRLGGVLGVSGGVSKRLRNVVCHVRANFILSGASWGRLGGILAPSCGHLGASWARLVRILARLGASWAHFGVSWKCF